MSDTAPPAAFLPPEAPIDMPQQRLDGEPPQRRSSVMTSRAMVARRASLLAATLLVALVATIAMRDALRRDGLDWVDTVFLTFFFPLFGWIAFGFVTASVGFFSLMWGKNPALAPLVGPDAALRTRTAVLVPIYHEDAGAVAGRIRQMGEQLAKTGHDGAFHFFVLSDSSLESEAHEHQVFSKLASRLPCTLFYRRRARNIGRKPGNIAEWVRRFGSAYDHMLVLDADSLMSARAITSMAATMERDPNLALVQTVPWIVGAQSLFQRWMQFANWMYGPVASAGLIWWSGKEATFWGHNAIIRTAAFAQSCGLPDLPGKAPFGGHIMSHDIVEAALLRRRGWTAQMVMMDGSYEEYPPTLIEHARRDRRWMQGNIQHLRLLGASGFHVVSRFQLLVGASAYVTSPAWLLLILASLAAVLVDHERTIDTAPPPGVLVLTLIMLFGTKLMAVIWVLSDDGRTRSFGGAGAILRSVAMDVPLSILMAPVTMLTQTMQLAEVLLGRTSGWAPQDRDRDLPDARELRQVYGWHVLFGIVLLAVTPIVPVTGAWLAPVTIGLLLAPFLARVTASKPLGNRLGARRLFFTPFDRPQAAPPPAVTPTMASPRRLQAS